MTSPVSRLNSLISLSLQMQTTARDSRIPAAARDSMVAQLRALNKPVADALTESAKAKRQVAAIEDAAKNTAEVVTATSVAPTGAVSSTDPTAGDASSATTADPASGPQPAAIGGTIDTFA